MRHFQYTCLMLLFIYGFAAVSAEQPNKNSSDVIFHAMDVNGDGKLSPDEHAAGAKNMFDTMDANKDGKVTPDEMDAAHERIKGRTAGKADLSSAEKIKAVDTNKDGILTAEEHAAASKRMFNKMDTDRDSFLNSEEWAEGHKKLLQRRQSGH